MAFEQLMAEAQIKKDKKEERRQRRDKQKEKASRSKDNLNSTPPPSEYTQHGTGEKYNPNA